MRIRAVKTVMVRDGAFNVHVFDCIGLYECARIYVVYILLLTVSIILMYCRG